MKNAIRREVELWRSAIELFTYTLVYLLGILGVVRYLRVLQEVSYGKSQSDKIPGFLQCIY